MVDVNRFHNLWRANLFSAGWELSNDLADVPALWMWLVFFVAVIADSCAGSLANGRSLHQIRSRTAGPNTGHGFVSRLWISHKTNCFFKWLP